MNQERIRQQQADSRESATLAESLVPFGQNWVYRGKPFQDRYEHNEDSWNGRMAGRTPWM